MELKLFKSMIVGNIVVNSILVDSAAVAQLLLIQATDNSDWDYVYTSNS